ncbi:MAG: hypothetical protein AAGF11_07615 [Myxococcota bacterium]
MSTLVHGHDRVESPVSIVDLARSFLEQPKYEFRGSSRFVEQDNTKRETDMTNQVATVKKGETIYISGASASQSAAASTITITGGTVAKAPTVGQTYQIVGSGGLLDTYGTCTSADTATSTFIFENRE